MFLWSVGHFAPCKISVDCRSPSRASTASRERAASLMLARTRQRRVLLGWPPRWCCTTLSISTTLSAARRGMIRCGNNRVCNTPIAGKPNMMRHSEFDTHRWSRMKDDQLLLKCVVTSKRNGWTHAGYEVRLFSQSQLIYRSRLCLTRRLANDEADSLLHDTLLSISRDGFGGEPNARPAALGAGDRDKPRSSFRAFEHPFDRCTAVPR